MPTRTTPPSRPRSPRAAGGAPPDLPDGALLPFLVVTFAIPWALLGLFMLDPWRATRWLGEPSGAHPLFIVSVWAPAIAALLVVARHGGRGALRRYLGRLVRWRAPVGWWAFLLVGMPAVFYGGALLRGGPEAMVWWPAVGVGDLAIAAAFMLVLGPVEELGWRGVALPLMQRHMAPLWAGLVVGGLWAVWHLPAFLVAGTAQSGWDFSPFVLGTVAAAVLMAALVNAGGGSILLAVLFHFQMNNPLWPDARPWDSVLLAGAAVVLVAVCPHALLRREAGVTQVIPAPADPARTRPAVVAGPR